MKELKKKIEFLAALALLPLSVNAQILDMSVDLSPLNLSDDFLRSLYYCKPYHGEKDSSYNGVTAKTVYDIAKTEKGECILKVGGLTNTSVQITQNCVLSAKQAQEYAELLSNFRAKGYKPRFDGDRINADEDYKKAFAVMNDRQICHVMRAAIDHTADIRANLAECKPVKNTENIAGDEVTREIMGKDGRKCRFNYTFREPAPDTSGITPEALEKAPSLEAPVYKYECRWNDKQLKEYLNILEAAVIPAEEGYDFTAADRPDSGEETDFIIANCDYVTEK